METVLAVHEYTQTPMHSYNLSEHTHTVYGSRERERALATALAESQIM